ncbi:MAG: serine hydrolase domain-containing protein [Saprospiraceae bacterium]
MKKSYQYVLLIFALLYLSSSVAQGSDQAVAQQEALEKAVAKTLITYQMPGLSVVVVDKAKILGLAAKGKRKQTAEGKLTVTDRMHLGSNTKAMTGFLAAQLVAEGKIKWETKVLDLFPNWKTNTKPAYQNITLQELLSHRAQIQPFTAGIDFMIIPPAEGTIVERRKKFAAWVLTLEPVKIDPTTGYTYSNAGYAIASTMLEAVTGEAWEDLLKTYLFAPLKIEAGYDWPAMKDQDQPWGHLDGAPHDPNSEYHLDALVAAAGAVNMSTQDYAKFLQLQLKGLAGEDDLLPAKTVQFLHTANAAAGRYGIGWGRTTIDAIPVHYHDGSAGTFYCHSLIFTEAGIAFAILTNAADQKTVEGVYDLSKQLRGIFLTTK